MEKLAVRPWAELALVVSTDFAHRQMSRQLGAGPEREAGILAWGWMDDAWTVIDVGWCLCFPVLCGWLAGMERVGLWF